MNASELKRYIYEEEKVVTILESLGCHHISSNLQYTSCGMPDGDNTKSTIIYNDEFLGVQAYTRNIKDRYGNSDILSLVGFINKEENFSKVIKWTCDVLGLDYYSDTIDDVPESIKWTKWMLQMASGETEEEKSYLKPINPKILSYYIKASHKMLSDEGVPPSVQDFFEVGYDLHSHRITFPIRDELGTLVGVKGRAINEMQGDKYIYLEPCAKSHVLYGLYQNYESIKKLNQIIIVESEKSVMKLFQNGYFNAVAIGGHQLSKSQVEKITRLNLDEVIICYDEEVGRLEDGTIDKNTYKDEVSKFIKQQKVSLMVDFNKSLLLDKESPADNIEKFKKLYENRVKIKRG